MTKKFSINLAIFFSLLWLSQPILSQQQESSSESESGSQPDGRAIEEITVQGERTFYALRLAIDSAETEVYNLFNELNSNDEFDVTCKEVRYTSSHISRRTCMAAYLRKEEAYHVQDYVQSIQLGGGLVSGGLGTPGSGMLLTLEDAKGEVFQKTSAMEQEMLRLAMEVPEFSAALQKLAGLVGALEDREKNSLNRWKWWKDR